MGIFSKPKAASPRQLQPPGHIAIIMDGNGRWAKKRGLPRSAGHAAGAETFRRIATYCKDIGVKYLTVYAFSTENWKRPADEVGSIMSLLDKYLREAIEKMERDHIKMRFFGDTSVLSPSLRALIKETDAISDRLEGFCVNICVNYGGRDDILRAVRAYAREYPQRGDISESEFGEYLYSKGVPDPELIIRPSGEMRLSNFLLWQAAYAELYFTEVYWPDFTERELNRAIEAYHGRDRRFGGVR